MHSDWTDGSRPIEDMVNAAIARGYEYMAITDHSVGLAMTGGLDPARIAQQRDEIAVIGKRHPEITILAGSEVEIKRDGTLDFPDDVLARLDWVVASVHSGFNQPEEEMTQRILRAIENPHVDCIGHPTGRMINKRSPYAVDLERVFRAAARTRTVLEINSFPERLDLPDAQARRARDLGVTLVINTDSHSPAHMDNIRYGVAMARRAWTEPGGVLNTLPLKKLQAWLRNA
jgi:DNA polymerase (family 10)